MLDPALQDEIRDAYQSLIEHRKLNPRWGQRQMIAEVANALGDPDAPEPIAVVEAGTGTGKTIAYCVAALPIARAREKKLVIATATVALQEQLIYRDLPDILEHSGLAFSVQLAKGRGRYVCLQKLEYHLAGASAPALIPLYPDEVADLAIEEAGPIMESMVESLSASRWDGDLDSWPTVLDDGLRRMVTTDQAQCGGRRCGFINQCAFYRARDGLQDADVVVANHNLVLADLKFGGGAILPPPEDSIYIFDEGHQLAEKCLSQFTLVARTVGTRQALIETATWLESQSDDLADITQQHDVLEQLGIALNDTTQLNDEAALWAEDFLARQVDQQEEFRFELGIAPDELRALAGRLAVAWSHQLELAQRLEAALDNRRDEVDIAQRDTLDAHLVNAQGMAVRAQGQVDLWRSYDGASNQDFDDPWVRWLRQSRTGNGIDFLASPILARDLLREHIWQRAAGVVMTSATLSSLGSFDRLQAMTGLPDGARYKRVESPFNTQQAVFSIPALQQEPGDADAHTAEIIEYLPELIANDLGVLVLFSSRRQMEAVVMGLEGVLPHRMLVQDSLSKSLLLETHRQTIDENQPSVIMGLASFAEGVDLPGAYCTHVVIAKLPFAVPDNPRDAAHAELLEQQGRNAFMEISVPDAALKLVQASGRLLRTEEDSGRITLLDRRLLTRRYGRSILESLPRYRFDLATGQAD
ncbi:MAG: ATP-dependent DNA helicase DinG [Halieaceae bacterium]